MVKKTFTSDQKIRNDTLKELLKVKNKLYVRTYNAYRNKITDKRIDAVKRIRAELKVLDLANIKTTTLKDVKQIIKDVHMTLTKFIII